ncbi:8738_t:CDS:1, partial [Ambispora gerdemannii]
SPLTSIKDKTRVVPSFGLENGGVKTQFRSRGRSISHGKHEH